MIYSRFVKVLPKSSKIQPNIFLFIKSIKLDSVAPICSVIRVLYTHQ